MYSSYVHTCILVYLRPLYDTTPSTASAIISVTTKYNTHADVSDKISYKIRIRYLNSPDNVMARTDQPKDDCKYHLMNYYPIFADAMFVLMKIYLKTNQVAYSVLFSIDDNGMYLMFV